MSRFSFQPRAGGPPPPSTGLSFGSSAMNARAPAGGAPFSFMSITDPASMMNTTPMTKLDNGVVQQKVRVTGEFHPEANTLLALDYTSRGKAETHDSYPAAQVENVLSASTGPGQLSGLNKKYTLIGVVTDATYHKGKGYTVVTVTKKGPVLMKNYWRGQELGRGTLVVKWGVVGTKIGAVFTADEDDDEVQHMVLDDDDERVREERLSIEPIPIASLTLDDPVNEYALQISGVLRLIH